MPQLVIMIFINTTKFGLISKLEKGHIIIKTRRLKMLIFPDKDILFYVNFLFCFYSNFDSRHHAYYHNSFHYYFHYYCHYYFLSLHCHYDFFIFNTLNFY